MRTIPSYVDISIETLQGLVIPEYMVELMRNTMRPGYLYGRTETDESKLRRAEYVAACAEYANRVAAITDPLARSILDLHHVDDYGDCPECSGDEWGTHWPCDTASTVAEHYGIDYAIEPFYPSFTEPSQMPQTLNIPKSGPSDE